MSILSKEDLDYDLTSEAERDACIAICLVYGIDPYKKQLGMGVICPKDIEYPAWQYQLPAVRAVFKVLDPEGYAASKAFDDIMKGN